MLSFRQLSERVNDDESVIADVCLSHWERGQVQRCKSKRCVFSKGDLEGRLSLSVYVCVCLSVFLPYMFVTCRYILMFHLDCQLARVQITSETNIWACLWGCFQRGFTWEGKTNPDGGHQDLCPLQELNTLLTPEPSLQPWLSLFLAFLFLLVSLLAFI